MSTYLGDANYWVAISTAESAGAPSGQIVRLHAEKYNRAFKDGQPSKPSSEGNAFRYANGKRGLVIDLTNCTIPPQSGSTATQQINLLWNFTFTYSNKIGSSKLYLWLKNLADNDYIALGYYSSAQTDYMTGYIDTLTDNGEKGKLYTAQIKFMEQTN